MLLRHPEVAYRSCEFCQQFVHDEKTGRVEVYKSGSLKGQPLPRAKRNRPMCERSAGCPKGTPDDQLSLTPRNRRVYEHYLRCKAVNWQGVAIDRLVMFHAAIIREVEDAFARSEQSRNLVELIKIIRPR